MEKMGWYLLETDPLTHGHYCHDCGYFQIGKICYKLAHGKNGRRICSDCHNKHHR